MKIQQEVPTIKTQEGTVNRRKLIKKVKRKVKKENQRIVKDFQWINNEPRSALGSFMSHNNAEECDFDMNNHITMGQNRKLKKRLKKLQKKEPENRDKVFKEMQKYKESLYKGHEKKIFNPVNELQKRRDKRMKRMESNAKRRKAEVTQKNSLDRFE